MTAPSVVPGRGTPLDASVAAEVMGWESVDMPISNRRFDSFVGPYDEMRGQFIIQNGEVMRRTSHRRWMPWSPSTDIAAAWEVVEKLGVRGFSTDIEWKGEDREYPQTAEVSMRKLIFTMGHAVVTAPEAICRAALMAVEASRRDPAPAVDRSRSYPDAAAVATAVPSRDAGGADQ